MPGKFIAMTEPGHRLNVCHIEGIVSGISQNDPGQPVACILGRQSGNEVVADVLPDVIKSLHEDFDNIR